MRQWLRSAMFALCLCAAAGCDRLVEVDNAGVIEADKLDPVRDGPMFSLSARQNFATAYGKLIAFSAWFTGEAISAESLPWISDFDRRAVTIENPDLLTLWSELSVARASAERVVVGLEKSPGAAMNVDRARAALFAGYSYLFMAEHFCSGAADAGVVLDANEMLRRAIGHFSTAIRVGEGASSAEAKTIAATARVGRARALLQSGDRAGAITESALVPTGFSYSLLYSNDVANRGRLGNFLWYVTHSRGALSVAPAYRNLDDERVQVLPPTPGFPPIDGVTPLWTQQKYPAFDAPIRLASRLEADYILAEAQGGSAMLALVQARRAAHRQPAYTGSTDANALLAELMLQRSRDFFLEGKRLGDIRRNPGRVPNVRQPGSPYHKPEFAVVANQACYPLPAKETAR